MQGKQRESRTKVVIRDNKNECKHECKYTAVIVEVTARNTTITYGCWFKSRLLYIQFCSLFVCLGKQQMARVSRTLPPRKETWMEIQAAGFDLAQSLCSSGRCTSKWKSQNILVFLKNSITPSLKWTQVSTHGYKEEQSTGAKSEKAPGTLTRR